MNKIEHNKYKNDINEAANEYYALSLKGASLTNSMQKLILAVYIYLSKRHKYSFKFLAYSSEKCGCKLNSAAYQKYIEAVKGKKLPDPLFTIRGEYLRNYSVR